MKVMNFFLKRILFFCLPFLILFLIYIVTDPFKVIYNYDNYYERGDCTFINRDYVSTQMYLNNSRKYIYDSFIFGSSTSLFLPPRIWGKYINTSNYMFSFDASGENIAGIWSKIKFINNSGNRIKNALLVFDTDVTFRKFKNEGHIFMKHYKVYPSSALNFQYRSFLSFLNVKYLTAIVHYKISNHFYPYMRNILEDRIYDYNLITNEEYEIGPDSELKRDSLDYYEKRKNMFIRYNSKPQEIYPQINEGHILMLKEIKEIFVNDSTNYRIVITPLYNQINFNNNDLEILQTIFGERNVFDFSGVNEYTEKVSNYYDDTHFKVYVGEDLFRIIYTVK
jgi:hypothetical protein